MLNDVLASVVVLLFVLAQPVGKITHMRTSNVNI